MLRLTKLLILIGIKKRFSKKLKFNSFRLAKNERYANFVDISNEYNVWKSGFRKLLIFLKIRFIN